MDIPAMKEYILENNYAPVILEKLGCHHIKNKGDYITCGNADGGDNSCAVTVYLNTNLTVVNYTRTLNINKKSHDIFDLAEFYLNINFFEAVKQLCDWCDLDYHADLNEELPESIKITKMILELNNGVDVEDDYSPVKPINEKILNYYYPYVNDLFKKDGISYTTQQIFEVGYDDFTNRITIPIRDELGYLVGIKGRLFAKELKENDIKYLYIEPCNKSKILYGLDKSYNHIKEKQCVYIGESEKFTMQLWTMGFQNVVSTGGKQISQYQIDMLSRLCVDIIICFDKDVTEQELQDIANRFIDGVKVYALIDKDNILNKKESPSDDPIKFKKLIDKNKYLMR